MSDIKGGSLDYKTDSCYRTVGASPDVSPLRVVLAHDFLIGMRGGEKVLEAICECFPQAPLRALLYAPRGLSTCDH